MEFIAHTDGVTPLNITLPIDKPDGAAKIVRVPDPIAKRVAHLVLHEQDLTKASVFLAEFEQLGEASYEALGQQLWVLVRGTQCDDEVFRPKSCARKAQSNNHFRSGWRQQPRQVCVR